MPIICGHYLLHELMNIGRSNTPQDIDDNVSTQLMRDVFRLSLSSICTLNNG